MQPINDNHTMNRRKFLGVVAGFQIRHADNGELRQCKVAGDKHGPDYFTPAVEANDTTGVKIIAFSGESAHPDQFKGIFINESSPSGKSS